MYFAKNKTLFDSENEVNKKNKKVLSCFDRLRYV